MCVCVCVCVLRWTDVRVLWEWLLWGFAVPSVELVKSCGLLSQWIGVKYLCKGMCASHIDEWTRV